MKKLADKKQYFDSGDYNMQKERTKLTKPNPLAMRMPGKYISESTRQYQIKD